ncbi:MAG TPA: hypothetical protein VLH86_01085 [Patescibacteria group bacterium]|nr:hypothetical protein [Patescibacteria group bacterium]
MKTPAKPPIKPVVTICSSVSFYRQAIDVKAQLEALGVTVVVPLVALKMQESGDFEVSHYKTWFADENDYGKKAELMRTHFDKVAAGDATLVLNYEKHGHKNYIGANVLMEMSLAFYLKQPIFVINELPADSPFEEELKGMAPTLLRGDITLLPALLAKLPTA